MEPKQIRTYDTFWDCLNIIYFQKNNGLLHKKVHIKRLNHTLNTLPKIYNISSRQNLSR